MTLTFLPERIVCLTEEPTEVLYLLGEQHRIVGISGFTVRPAIARKEKPKVSAFTDANIEKIMALKPDLVIGFSDIQAEIAKTLIANGITVWINNHRSVEEIKKMVVQLGSLVGKYNEAIHLVSGWQKEMESIKLNHLHRHRKPGVYFEEWYDPLISGIRWVSEIIEIAGGKDIFKEIQHTSLARDRIIADPSEVVRRNPDIILASWCGKKFKKDRLVNRAGWDQINAVQNDQVFEVDSSIILQPGPAALTEGIRQIAAIVDQWHATYGHDPGLT